MREKKSPATRKGSRAEITEVPSAANPLGIKPGSEGGTAPAPAVVTNAIVDALAGLGVRHIELPATSERVWRAIQAAQRGVIG